MAESAFEKRVITRLDVLEKSVNTILGYIEDSRLDAQDKIAIDLALKEEKQGKLLRKEQVFG